MNDGWEYLGDDLTAMLRVLQGSDVREVELSDGEMSIRVHRTGMVRKQPPVETKTEPDTPVEEPMETEITASLVGTFYRAEKPGMPPLASEGTRVQDDSIVGIIESLNVLTEVEAGCSGTVSRVLATDGQPVEYGQVLFEVRVGD